MTKVVFVYC